MSEIPTYEDLEKRIESLQKECSDLNRMTTRLLDSENKYRTFFENSLDALFITRPDGQILEANAAACGMFGYTEEELIRLGRNAIIDPEDPRLLSGLKERAREGRFAGELTHKRKDGTIFPAEIASVVFKNINGEEQESIIIRDITERNKAADALRISEDYIRAIIDHLPVGLAVNSVDPAVDFVYMNDNFPRFYRTTREALSDPDAFWDVVYEDPAFREKMKKRVLEDCASNDPERMHWDDVPITRRGEETVYINARNTPVPEKSLMISTVWDITDRKLAEIEKEKLREQLLEAQRMEAVGTLAGGIAHDFNNALMGIMGFTEVLKSNLPKDGPDQSDLDEIMRCAERASMLTRQLLTYARRQIIDPVDLNLNRVITDLVRLVSKVLGEQIEIKTVLKEGLPAIFADLGQIEQVVMNLVLNSRDAMPGGGRLAIETGLADIDDDFYYHYPHMKPGSYVTLTVSDTGIGMEKAIEERAFDPFFTTKSPDRGTGLGLSMVYGVVKQHNGFIHLSSEPGKGTSFKIYLPAVEGNPETIDSLNPSEIKGGTETILLAEDDEWVRKLIERTLTVLGYTVLVTRDGEEAVEAFRKNGDRIHLALLDVVMPRKGGKEAHGDMRKSKADLKAIFMSGYTASALHESFVLNAGVSFLSKPFSPGALARKIREVLDGTCR